MQTIIANLDIKPHLRPAYLKMAEFYTANLPYSLYWNYYELAEKSGTSPAVWEDFLDIKDIDAWVNAKVAKLTEIDARAALNKLSSSSTVTPTEVAALKELIAKSKLIQQNQNRQPTVVLTYVPQRHVAPA